MWGLRFEFEQTPQTLEVFRRDGDRLSGSGAGSVTITTPDGETFTEKMPFDRYAF
jgi:hypothetical protein